MLKLQIARGVLKNTDDEVYTFRLLDTETGELLTEDYFCADGHNNETAKALIIEILTEEGYLKVTA